MEGSRGLVTAGRVGRPHGLDGSFAVLHPQVELAVGMVVSVAGRERRVERVAGTGERPLLRLAGIADRARAKALGGELLLISDSRAPLGEGEWLAADLVGCRVEGLGAVRRVLPGPSCDVLELEDGALVPLVSDAVRAVDLPRRRISVDRRFLGF